MNNLAIIDSIKKNHKITALLTLIFITLLFIDSYTSSISDVAGDFIKTTFGIALFMSITIVSLFASYLAITKILGILEQRKSLISRYRKIFRLIQAILFSLSAFLLLDILIQNKFSTTNLIVIMILSYGSSVIMSLFFCIKLFSWFKDNKNKFSILFGSAIFFIFINNLVSIFLFTILLSEKPVQINYSTPIIFNFECSEDTFYCFIKENVINIQSYTVIAYYSLFWICNYFLLHYHIQKIGRVRFYTLVTLPLFLYFFVFGYNYDVLYSLNEGLKIDEGIIFAFQIFIVILAGALCGVLYGMGFRSIANLLKMSPSIERYLKTVSYGIILFFITAGATLVGTSIPPYGMASIIFLPFSLILFYVGIYYSIIAVSNDISIRKYIKNSTYNELKIMGNLAQSQMVDNMKEKVLGMTKKYSEEIHQKSNSESMETEEDLRSYLDEAIRIFNKGNKNKT